MSSTRRPLHALTGARIIAALWVMLHHAIWFAGDEVPAWLLNFAHLGYLAVSFFFVLSGFILTYTYADTINSASSRKSYAVNRFARIYPVYILSFLADAPRAVMYFLNTYGPDEAIVKSVISATAFLTLSQSWIPRVAVAWNAPGWSLSAEAFFYVLFPSISLRAFQLKSRRAVLAALFFVFATSLTLNLLAVEIAKRGPAWLPGFLAAFPPLYLGDFIVGVLAARFVAIFPSIQQLRPSASFGLTVAGFSIALVVPLILAPIIHMGFHALVCIAFAIVIVSLAVESNPVSRMLSRPPIVLLGASSYAVYLLHQPILSLFVNLTGYEPGKLTLILYLVTVTFVSIGVFAFYEEPARLLLRKRLNSPKFDPSRETC